MSRNASTAISPGPDAENMPAHHTDRVIRHLHDHIERDEQNFVALLEQSLKEARERAAEELREPLFEALTWPTDFNGYTAYVADFLRWIPYQSDHEAWQNADSDRERHDQEVYDRLCHFFWLIDQNVGDDSSAIIENVDWFRDWLLECARDWGAFLDTPASFSEEILESFVKNAPQYRIEESLIDGKPNQPSGWLTFNQFFARQLNSGLRPIEAPQDNHVLTSAADCGYQRQFDIDEDSKIPATRVKRTHAYGDVAELLDGSTYADAFAGGTFVHYALPPSAYHRYHVPAAGRVREAFTVDGRAYLKVSLGEGGFNSHDDATTGYEFSQTRGVVILDTRESDAGDIGLVGLVPVGMSHVGSINLTAARDRDVAKGDEFGYFLFGGSDMILLFQRHVTPNFLTDLGFQLYGSRIATC
ncbi:phosphatidylserine decarboxylase [Salinisphaera hydrothermalis]|uniref:phosphatidylserine decarboxylase n=1 Tax=Salinisphaera hydrothermalis TaxID=563188 RepID=UPI0033402BBE